MIAYEIKGLGLKKFPILIPSTVIKFYRQESYQGVVGSCYLIRIYGGVFLSYICEY